MSTHDIPCMILAAGRGERMRPLTDYVPKPLLEIHGKSLLEHHLARLKANGFSRIVINHAWLGHMIEEKFGDGSSLGLNIQYSGEKEALETAGGIRQALDRLAPEDYFFVINGDVYAPDFPLHRTSIIIDKLRNENLTKPDLEHATLAYLFLVQNPAHHPQGDFFIAPSNEGFEKMNKQGQAFHQIYSELPGEKMDYSDLKVGDSKSIQRYTFSGAGIYHKSLFDQLTPGLKAPLAPLLKKAMATNQVFGELLSCSWHDVGSPERLNELNQS